MTFPKQVTFSQFIGEQEKFSRQIFQTLVV